MKTVEQIIIDNPDATDVEIAGLYNQQPSTPKPSSLATFVTFTSIGEDTARFGAGAMNLAGKMRAGLTAWAAAPDLSDLNPALPNRGALQTIADRMAGAKGVDISSPNAPALLDLFASGVDQAHPPLMTTNQAAALLSIGYYVVTPTDAAGVADVRAAVARETRRTQWIDAKLHADAKASAVIDADPLNATVDAVAAAYADELAARMEAGE